MNFYPYTTAFTEIEVEPDGFEKTIELAKNVRSRTGRVFFIGNGGSAAIASHMAIDWLNKAKFSAFALNDPASLTCLSNDYGYETVFSIPLMAHYFGNNDLLFAISSSGKSRNLLKALPADGKIVTLSGFDRENPLRLEGDINFYVPSYDYGVVETVHLGILHTLLDSLC